MKWNKVNLRVKNKNLPPVGETVVWATNEKSNDKKVFYKFFGHLSSDEKYIDTGFYRYKISSNYWWGIINDPE